MKKTFLAILSLLSFSLFSSAKDNTNVKVEIQTEFGKIVLLLYNNTPKHRDNFIKLANEHYYDSTLFHRVIPQFMIQGGDPQSKHAAADAMLGSGDVGYKIPAEINKANYHKYGVLAAARDGNPEKASSGCQFYIVVGRTFTDADLDMIDKQHTNKYTPEQREMYKTKGGTPHLDENYTVFGEVLEGMDIVEKIVNQPRNKMDRPDKDMMMIKVRVVKKKKFLGIF